MSHFEDTLTIRKAELADIPVIKTLAHAIWPGTYGSILPPGQVEYMLDLFYTDEALAKQFEEGHQFFIAEVNAECVAFASYSHGNQAGVYKVNKLYVHEAVQGKGVGKHLLDTMVAEVKHKQGKLLELCVYRFNPAKEFYEKYGFSVSKEVEEPIGEGFFLRDYLMVKEI